MGFESQPKKYPKDVRVQREKYTPGWENLTVTPEEAKQQYRSIERLLALVNAPLSKNDKILELGSGAGALINYMREQGHDAIGIDTNTRGKAGTLQVEARIEQMPFADNSFDLIVSNGVLDSYTYLQDQVEMMHEVARLLRPGGYYVALFDEIKTNLGDERLERIEFDNQTMFMRAVFKKKAETP